MKCILSSLTENASEPSTKTSDRKNANELRNQVLATQSRKPIPGFNFTV